MTLITGDQVSVAADGSVAGIRRGSGREDASFSVREADGHSFVIPLDAALLVAQGKLDRRLFDVTQLLAYGYDDASRSDLPLIVTYAGDETPTTSAFRDVRARVGQTLNAINGVALRADKRGHSALWHTLTDGDDGGQGTARLSGAPVASQVKRVWLDGKRQAGLDRSVPQVGAPTAWDAGFDGSGVTVAVLDTGVDQTHSDLASQEIAERNFTDSADNVDRVGHGTHVASTVAGTGAKSDGRYKGVAPGARILDGKVLDDTGSGLDSGIIAGMEWAVAEGAHVVSMSLGGTDTQEVDPLEEAVNRLSAETDTLFVIAAGNSGEFGEGTIDSPGSAEAALTVGAVDKSDALAPFSSRGPRVGDGGVKPDLTAPGVDITAAAAAGSDVAKSALAETPGYATLSGTSMATPHVAGAAAILAQRHPDWTGERIKADLTASTEPGPYGAYQQGTGRADVARAIGQTVVSEGPVSFGRPKWPHHDDVAVTREITYRNLSSEPVVLNLAIEALGADARPAPDGMFALSSRQVTLPAGGTASTSVTADTRVGGESYGAFGGSVTAVSDDGRTSVRTAFGVEREAESYDLTIKHVGDDGKAFPSGWTTVEGRDTSYYQVSTDPADGEVTVRLPKGSYALTGILPADGAAATTASLLLAPALDLTKDTTVVMDARKAKATRVTLPDTGAVNNHAQFIPGYTASDGRRLHYIPPIYDFPDFQSFKVGHIGRKVSKEVAYAQYSGFWTRQSADGHAVNYRLAWNRQGSLGGFTAHVRRKQLAEIDFTVGRPGPLPTAQISAIPITPIGELGADFSTPTERPLPLRTTEYVLGNGVRWTYGVYQSEADYSQSAPAMAYAPNRRYTALFNAGVFGPVLSTAKGEPGWGGRAGLARSGNTIKAHLPLFGDSDGHESSTAAARVVSSLRADGKEITTEGDPLNIAWYSVPAEDSRYELSVDASLDPEFFRVSTRVRAQWTFDSAHVEEGNWTRLPLSVVRFAPKLSLTSTAKAGTRFEVPFTVQGAGTAATAKKLAFEVSYDEGSTWTTVEAIDGDHLVLDHPAQPGSVSLRAKLTDRDGNTLVQTIDRAYLTVR
ncbi:S8 family serine peptidase [Streptomyces toyocaensis]|uniref:S8 family peptidase n=1 Tax=Streptomyces toyocaensis TaxID=55952 RepID=UPI003409EFE7